MRLALYSPDVPDVPGGVADHTLVLARALAARGADVAVLALRGDPARFAPIPCTVGVRPRSRTGAGLADALRDAGATAVLVQYVPFLFARHGVAPSLVAALRAVRRRGVRVGLFVHEPFVPPTRLPWLVTGLLQRAQLAALLRLADRAYAPAPALARLVRRWAPSGALVDVAPVGATLPRSGLSRAEARRLKGLGEDEVAVGVFSPSASGFLSDWVVAAHSATARMPGVRWFLFGRGTDALEERIGGPDVTALGEAPAREITDTMAAMDVALAPYVDGLTLRRTAAMLALAHGVATVSSRGHLFDASLADAASCAGTAVEFAAAVSDLAADRGRRNPLAAAGRAFYERAGSVDVLASRLWHDLADGPA